MASRIAAAAKGIRFASNANVANASNPWLAERIAVKEHAGPAAETWRKITLYACIPALIAASFNAHNLYARHQAHLAHEKQEGHERVKYPYMRLRAKAIGVHIRTLKKPSTEPFNGPKRHDQKIAPTLQHDNQDSQGTRCSGIDADNDADSYAWKTEKDSKFRDAKPIPRSTKGKAEEYSNICGIQHCNPGQVFHPSTIEDLVEIVHKAKSENRKIRCAGTGYTLSSCSMVQDGGFLVINQMMNKISAPVQLKDDLWTVEIETGVLIKDLDDLLRMHEPPLTLPSNVVFDTARYGGLISLGCHGAGTQSGTLPDLVHEVKIVDADGNLNVFSKEKDPIEFFAAAQNLGLLGIIYSFKLRVEPMFNLYATDTDPLLSEYFGSPEKCGPMLKNMVLGNDQTEIFYWPFNTLNFNSTEDRVWIKQWQRTKVPITASSWVVTLQNRFQDCLLGLGDTAMQTMTVWPATTPIVAYLTGKMSRVTGERVYSAPDAIHHYAASGLVRCIAVEMAFKCDENFENVVRAWNYPINLLYEHANRGEFPLNFPMEMRFVKASQMLMSNAYDDDPNAIYCMMEVISVVNTEGFEDFSIKVANYWMDEFQARPHWAKVWEHIPGMAPYLRKQMGSRVELFESIRKKYDPQGIFMNDTFAELLGH
ncbi:hypothetical protein BGX28_008916 [Mortierella sp. GBA30]|nr:hypothetical protein BGX28_008916 [Mortierella sp. GBA30]